MPDGGRAGCRMREGEGDRTAPRRRRFLNLSAQHVRFYGLGAHVLCRMAMST